MSRSVFPGLFFSLSNMVSSLLEGVQHNIYKQSNHKAFPQEAGWVAQEMAQVIVEHRESVLMKAESSFHLPLSLLFLK